MAERFFKDRLWDALERSLRDQTPAFLGFFDEHQAKEAALALGKQPEGFISFFGGYLGAERVMLGFFPSFQEKKSCFPLRAITAVFPDNYSLSHRDVLGTVMSVGVQRETIGDILVEQGRVVLFCRSEIVSLLLQKIDTIGGVGVKLQEGAQEPLPPLASFLILNDTVSSPRLDCVVAVLARISRGSASELIKKELVSVNHTIIRSVSLEVKENDVLSIRGYGKFRIDSIGPPTRKQRLHFSVRKYI